MIMKYTIEKSIKQSIYDTDSAKKYIDAIRKKFTMFDNVENRTLMKLFTTTAYDGIVSLRAYHETYSFL